MSESDLENLEQTESPLESSNTCKEISHEQLNELDEHENFEKLESDACAALNKDAELPKVNESKTIPKQIIDSERSKQRSAARKARVRYAKKRKWKPYCKLTWDERKKLEERDSRRACRFREKMSASGLTLAPYNTTQFLMEDHNLQEPDYESIHHDNKNKDDCHSYDSEDFYSSPDDEENFLQQQFTETYDSYRDAYINNMTKFELVRELIRLEDEIEEAEQALRENKEQKKLENSDLDLEAELEKIKVFKDEIAKLTQENYILEKKNEKLQNRLSRIKS